MNYKNKEFFSCDENSSGGECAQEANENESFDILKTSRAGYRLLKENKIAEAVECFNKILEVDPNNNYALVGLGDAARKKCSLHEAVAYYKKCLEFYDGNNYALFGLADCYKALNQYNKAIEIWERYLQHDDKNITVFTRVADAYRKVRNFKKSKSVYMQVLDLDPENPYAIIGLGHLHYDFKEYKEALFYWSKMLSRIPHVNIDIRVLTSIGNCHRKLKTFADGIPFFEQALEKDSQNFYAVFGLADCYRGLNKQEISLIYWNRILEQDPRSKVILTRAGDAYRNMSDYEKAKEYYERALNIEFDIYAVLGLALISKAQGKFNDAISSLRRIVQQDPKNHRLSLELADCYMKIGDKKQALTTLEDFQKQGVRNSQVALQLEALNSR